MDKRKKAAPATRSLHDYENKDNYFRYQRQVIYSFFLENQTTMYDAEKQTGVCRPSICRYVRQMEDRGLIERVYRALCPISGYMAWYWRSKRGGING